MKRLLISNIRVQSITLAVVILILCGNVGAQAYCYFNSWYWDQYGINLVKFEGQVIQKWDVPRDEYGNIYFYNTMNFAYAYKDIDYNNPMINMDKNKDYTMEVFGGARYLYEDYNNPIDENANCDSFYPMDFRVYVDFNQDGEFDEWNELVGQFDTEDWVYGGKFLIRIPNNALSGQTRMRVVANAYDDNGGNWLFNPCGAWDGEARDFAVYINEANDCGISRIISPATPLNSGLQPVTAGLYNYSGSPLTSCTINWSVDGVKQASVNWNGYLDAYNETEVTLGNYDFKSKGGKTTYVITAVTEKPNGADDADINNDAAPYYSVSIPLVPGIYYVGGLGYDFQTLKEATDLLNEAGINGDGDFTLRIRPGVYTGPFELNDFYHGNNNITFEADPANSGEVVLTTSPNPANYVFLTNNIPNVTFRNLTFSANDPYGWGGRIFVMRNNADNYTFEGNTFNGVKNFTQSLYTYSIIDCEATSMNKQKYIQNKFNDGYMSMVLIDYNQASSGLLLDENTFNSFSYGAIRIEGVSQAIITNNILTASATTTNSAISVNSGADIIHNSISGMQGNNSGGYAIFVQDYSLSSSANISNNIINSSNGVSGILAYGIDGGDISGNTIELLNSNTNSPIDGIQLIPGTPTSEKVVFSKNKITLENGFGIYGVNYNMDVLKNSIRINNSGTSTNLAGIYTANSNGMILMNEVFSNNQAMEINASNFVIAYNSTIALGSLENIKIQSGSNEVSRNQLVNKGSGSAITVLYPDNAVLSGNNYFSLSGTIGTVGGTTYTNLAEFTPVDNSARFTDPSYKSNYNLRITEFKDELAFDEPIGDEDWLTEYHNEYEDTTIDGLYRNEVFYIGAYNIFPTVTILSYTKELIDCSGTENQILVIAGTTTEGKEPNYQWYKDGIALPGETNHTLKFTNFDYTVSGDYTCKATFHGAVSKVTSPIPVYALTAPEIVEQPKEVVNAQLGGDYTFNVKVHYRGLVPPYYKDYFQWYKYDAAADDSVPLVDNERFGGTESSELTLKNLNADDICKPGDYYFVKVVGQCGTAYSDPFVISETPEVVFRDHPENLNPCPKSDVILTSSAIAPKGFTITYKWLKDGEYLVDGTKCNGSNTNKLQIYALEANDQGNYVCEATIPEVAVSKRSNAGEILLKQIPEGTPEGDAVITAKRGNDVTMTVIQLKGAEPITIKWMFNNEVLKEGVWDAYEGNKLLSILLEAVNENQSGEYKCVLENECEKTEIVFNLTVTKWDEQSVEVISDKGYTLFANYPNPAKGTTTIKFEMPQTENALITLIDVSGCKVSELFNGIANKGMNMLQINTDNLNVANGTYFYMLSTSGFNATMPMVIVK